jgi:ABC-type multidrug transport system fused ATPase/permease subunit
MKKNKIVKILLLLRKAFGEYKWQIILLTVLSVISGILEGIGINAIIPLLSLIVGDIIPSTDLISQFLERAFNFFNIDFAIESLLIFIAILFVAKAVFLFIIAYIKVKIVADYEKNVRNDLLKNHLFANWSHLIKERVGYLDTVLMTDVLRSSSLFNSFASLIIIVTSLIIYTFVALNIAFNITCLTIFVGAIFIFLIKPIIIKSRKLSYSVVQLKKTASHFITQHVIGMKTIKSLVVEKQVLKYADKYFEYFRELKVKIILLRHISGSIVQPLAVVMISLVFLFSYKSENFNFASIMAVMYLIQRIFIFIQQLQSNFHQINISIPHLLSILNHKKNVVQEKENSIGKSNFVFRDSLKFKDVEFSYKDGHKMILDSLSFTVKKGQMVGVIGPSGSGKTTVVDLFLRLFEPDKGEILLDDNPISNINIYNWRKRIGYVSQDEFVLNDTIENNIRFYDVSMTKQKIIKASKKAYIYDFIKSLPEGFDTIIGERGSNLSGGQVQRIILARILAREPKILILDEATSALDNESEKAIQETINRLQGKITIIVVAHRLSTVMGCDKICVIENGKIIEEGKPKELLRKNNSYFKKMFSMV